jgi:hypothetical protein
MNEYNVNLNTVIIKPLYIGLLMNIFIPSIIVMIVYYLESESSGRMVGSGVESDLILWVMAGFVLLDGSLALYIKQKRFFAPMIKSKETFAADFTEGVKIASIICFAITTAISIYGVVAYLISGLIDYLILFVVLSFIAYLLVRPRYRFLEKVLAAQENHVKEGRLLARQNKPLHPSQN